MVELIASFGRVDLRTVGDGTARRWDGRAVSRGGPHTRDVNVGLHPSRSFRLAAIEPDLLARVEDARARERELATPAGLAGILHGGDWESMPMSARRQVVRVVCSADLLGELRVGRSVPGHPTRSRHRWCGGV